MILMLTVTRDAASGGGKSVHRLASVRVRLGSAPDSDVALPGLPAVAATIESAGSRFRLTPGEGADWRLHREPVTGPVTVCNGDVLEAGAYSIRLNVIFPAAAQHRRVSLLPALAAALVAIVLIAEIAIGVWLPIAIGSRSRWGLEVSRQRTFALVDYLRVQVNHQHLPELDLRSRAALNLIRLELDRLTLYLRENESQLDARQLALLSEDLASLREAVSQIRGGTFFQGPRQLDYRKALENVLQPRDRQP